MSVRLMAAVWEHSRASGSELLVLLALADFANDDGTNVFPSQATIAQKARLSERNVRRILGKLRDLGELQWNSRAHASAKGASNEYRVIVQDKMSASGLGHPGQGFRTDCPEFRTPVSGGFRTPVSADPPVEPPDQIHQEPPVAAAAAFRAWEEASGTTITATVGDMIAEAVETHGLATVLDAIKETAANNVRAWKYPQAILRRWESEGREPRLKATPGGNPNWQDSERFRNGHWQNKFARTANASAGGSSSRKASGSGT